ncbi:MAG: ABC transporter ATP-binding protein [Alphaproteobacteria bacterium]|nr:ABC transporter ATP-binding protein [Alphaproteobacteria bacterium]
MLSVRDLDVFHGDAQALDGVSLDVAQGGIVAIVGANGAGKTSLIRTIAGMFTPRNGVIEFKGENIAGWPSHRVCDLGIGQVAEGRQVFPSLSVRENLEMGAMLPRAKAHRARNLEHGLAMFPKLKERYGQAAGTLSGGEQQMLAIGRALMTNPDLLILDEATEGLAPVIRAEIWRCIEALKGEGQSILIVDKNLRVLRRLADRHYAIEKGRTVWSGTGADLDRDAELVHRYVGV